VFKALHAKLDEIDRKLSRVLNLLSDKDTIDIAMLNLLAETHKDIFTAGVEAAKPESPEQIMLTPEDIAREQAQMVRDAGWIATGDGPPEDD